MAKSAFKSGQSGSRAWFDHYLSETQLLTEHKTGTEQTPSLVPFSGSKGSGQTVGSRRHATVGEKWFIPGVRGEQAEGLTN